MAQDTIQVIVPNAKKNFVQSCITGVESIGNIKWICSTCHLNIKEGKFLQCSKAIGMSFPDKTSVLDLIPLEERPISPRIPFRQNRELPQGGQLSIHGNVVNVPSDANSTVTVYYSNNKYLILIINNNNLIIVSSSVLLG